MHLHRPFRVSSVVTEYEHHVQEEEDTEDVIEDQEQSSGFYCSRQIQKKYTKAGSIF